MADDTQHYEVLVDFMHRPEILVIEDTTFRKLDLFPSSGEKERHLLSWAH
jgi:hypothetical protein